MTEEQYSLMIMLKYGAAYIEIKDVTGIQTDELEDTRHLRRGKVDKIEYHPHAPMHPNGPEYYEVGEKKLRNKLKIDFPGNHGVLWESLVSKVDELEEKIEKSRPQFATSSKP